MASNSGRPQLTRGRLPVGQSAHSIQHGSRFGGHVTVGHNSFLHQGNTIHYSPPVGRCLADLRVTDPRDDKARIEDAKGGLFKDSYRWILDHDDFIRWRYKNGGILWVHGDPGKGKTMLLCGIVDELHPTTKLANREAETLLSYFFFQATDDRINNATAVLRGLIYLLVQQQPALVSHIQEKYDDAGKTLFEDANAWFALSDIFRSILQDPSLKLTYLIIDALDECVTGLEQLLKLILQITPSPRVKWIVSSRNTVDIERHLTLDDVQMLLSLELKQNAELVSQAIGLYINNKLSRLQSLQDDGLLLDHVRRTLDQKAGGTFLWVALVVQELEKTESWYVKEVADEVPPGLDGLYARMMDQIQQLGRRDLGLCQLVLSAATLTYRPLHLLELGVVSGLPHTISSNAENIQNIVKKSGSFLTVQDGQVFIIHQSAKEYLQKNYNALQSAGFAQGHADISRRSIDAMSTLRRTDGELILKQDIYDTGDFGFRPKDIEPPNPDPLAPLRYSCQFWVDHLLDGESGDRRKALADDGAVFRFLKERFLRWLECLSLLGELSNGVLAMRKLLHVVQESGANPRLAGFLEDAEKFVRSHGSIIERAPLQTYGSALVFSPTRSDLKNVLWKERLSFIKTVTGIEDDWHAHQQTLEGHSSFVNAVAVSLDGKTLASASDDTTIRLWDAATGAYRQALKVHSDHVLAVAFSSDGKILASASADKTILFWNVATGIYRQTLKGHNGSVRTVAFSSDGKTLASGSADKTIRLWDAATGTYRQTLKGHSDSVYTVAFSSDSKTLASASTDKTIQLWDTATGIYRQTLKRHIDHIYTVAFSSDGKTLASASADKTIQLWDVATGIYRQTLKGHTGSVRTVAFSSDGKTLASGSADKTIRLWDATTGVYRQTLEGHSGSVRAVAFLSDGKTLASASADKTIQLWNTTTSIHQYTIKGHSDYIFAITFSSDGKTLASASADKTIRLWDATTGTHQQTLEGHNGYIFAIAFSSDNRTLASASADKTIRLWDTVTGTHQQTFKGHGDYIFTVVFSSDGKTLASASADKTIRLWDITTGICQQIFKGHSDWVSAVAFSSDGKTLASASADKTIRLWDTATSAHQLTLKGHSDYASAVAFSSDNKTVASASADKTIRLWDAATGAHVQTLEVQSTLGCLSFSANDECLNTDRGLLSVTLDPDALSSLGDQKPAGCFLFVADDWVTRNWKSLLWLPLEYRATRVAVHGCTLVLGNAAGQVTFFRYAFTE
ncbi:Pfs, NACHT and WD domain protein [Lasiosphaeria hispida]|uniref:Pfs, NACHT and WD domain protein n=1 Tax=Lasiosphaeria hispida TaxID=260671 RepID=A0AAJ0M7M6_9PEZI|nr:Pfs, NACHT and WD domain protein [Lasiosphaeria hispida]